MILTEGQRQRQYLSPAFAFRHIKDLYPIFWSKAGEIVDVLSATSRRDEHTDEMLDEHIDVNSWASRTTLDIIGVAGMGQDFNSIIDPSNELIRTYKTIFSPSRVGQIFALLRLFLPRWILSSLP